MSASAGVRSAQAAFGSVLQGLAADDSFEGWMVARARGPMWTLLAYAGKPLPSVEPGLTTPWADTICSRLCARGNEPDVCGDLAASPLYADAPVREAFGLAAYAGSPVRLPDGTLFGTVCAVSREPLTESRPTAALFPLLSTAAAALGALADTGRQIFAYERVEMRRAMPPAARCPVTGLANAAAWSVACAHETRRAAVLGLTTAVAIVQVMPHAADDPSDARATTLLSTKRAATIAAAACRKSDLVAYLGTERIAILLAECDAEGAQIVVERLRAQLFDAGIAARIGTGSSADTASVEAAQAQAVERARADAGTRSAASIGAGSRLSADAAALLAHFAGCRVSMASVIGGGGMPPERAMVALQQLKVTGLATLEPGGGRGVVAFADRRRALAAQGRPA